MGFLGLFHHSNEPEWLDVAVEAQIFDEMERERIRKENEPFNFGLSDLPNDDPDKWMDEMELLDDDDEW